MSDLPDIGLECRDEANHVWIKPVEAGREALGEAVYWRRYECERGCGTTKIRRYDKYGLYVPGSTRTWYETGYCVKGGIDPMDIGLMRVQEFGGRVPKGRRHLRSA